MVASTFQSLFAVAFVVLASVAQAQIPIFSSQQAQRAALNNTLMFDPNTLPQVPLPGGVTVQVGDVTAFPSLALPDVSMAFAQATIPAGADFPQHEHPLATELLLNIAGLQRVTIFQELTLPPLVFNTRPGQIVTLPQGLPHITTCLSKNSPCRFISSFNAPSPGVVFVTAGLPSM